MSGSGRPLAAAPSNREAGSSGENSGSQRNPERPPSLGRRPKRTLIESACSACRRRKSKCDGARPACSRCVALRTECVYEAEEGESRWSALRRQNKTMEQERDELREVLAYLQSRPEAEALDVFHRLRSSDVHESLASLLQHLRERRESGESQSGPSIVGGQTRLPPIRTMIEASERGGSPMGPPPRRSSLASDGSGASGGSGGSYESSHSAYDRMQPGSA